MEDKRTLIVSDRRGLALELLAIALAHPEIVIVDDMQPAPPPVPTAIVFDDLPRPNVRPARQRGRGILEMMIGLGANPI